MILTDSDDLSRGPSEPRQSLRSTLSSWRAGFILLLLAVFPFFLKTGLDLEAVQRQAVLSIYRNWRWSPEMRGLRSGAPLIFQREREKSPFEEDFKNQLQRDFKLVEMGDVPRVRAFFEAGVFLQARIEVSVPTKGSEAKNSLSSGWTSWESSARFVNNGLLLGAWLGLLLWLITRRFGLSAFASIFSMLLWQADWNILDVPGTVVSTLIDFCREIALRFEWHDWTSSDLGRLAEIGVVLWTLVALILYKTVLRSPKVRTLRSIALVSLVLEPLTLWMCSRFGQWGPEASWWKIYLGSFAFRFVTFGQLFLIFLRPQVADFSDRPSPSSVYRRETPAAFASLLLLVPMAFIWSGGWGWLNSVLFAGPGETLLRLKVFFVGCILSFVLGSRVFSMWVGLLAISVILPPSKGHWSAAAWYGLMMDGLMLGWWVSPFKGVRPVLAHVGSSMASRKAFAVVCLMAWLSGVFLSSVGAPLGVSWAALSLGVWAYAQLTFSSPHEPSNPDDSALRPVNG